MYQWLSLLLGWNRSHAQAISTDNARMRLLPALLMPCSCMLPPLSYGVGVKPASAPTSFRLLNSLQPKNSITKFHELTDPIPRSNSNWLTFRKLSVFGSLRRSFFSFSNIPIWSSTSRKRLYSISIRALRSDETSLPSHVRREVNSCKNFLLLGLLTRSPCWIRSPLIRFRILVLSLFNTSRSRPMFLASSSSALGTRTIAHSFFSPPW